MNNESQHPFTTPGIFHVLRLLPGEDLRISLLEYARQQKLTAAVLLTCAGSLTQFNIRFANQLTGNKKTGHFEILSLSGTLSMNSSHLHMCIADEHGMASGGHLLDGNLVYTTAEIVIVELQDLKFTRKHDPSSGFHELAISRN